MFTNGAKAEDGKEDLVGEGCASSADSRDLIMRSRERGLGGADGTS